MSKKQYTRLLSGITALLMLTSSCENEIPFNQGDARPILTMNGFVYADSLKNRLYLNLTGETITQAVGNTTVKITVNGELKETLNAIKQQETSLRFVDITTRFRPGDVVRIDARTDNGEYHAWVEETIPRPVEMNECFTAVEHMFNNSRTNVQQL